VANLEADTAVEGSDGDSKAELSPDWEIWGGAHRRRGPLSA
jgi:hypothetical protein